MQILSACCCNNRRFLEALGTRFATGNVYNNHFDAFGANLCQFVFAGAVILAPLFNGIFQVLISLGMILFVAMGSGINLIAWPAFFDNNSFLALFLLAAEYINPAIVIVVFIVGLLLINQLYYRKNKEHYYDHMN